jgi:GntR family transcriptional repressor for pyruvate dehydrogenase complex
VKEFEETLRYFSKVEVGKASDIIMNQIVKMLDEGLLKPGVRLPPERIMAEQFGVGRSQVREAITKLVSLGILKTMPQSGTYVQEAAKEGHARVLREIIEKSRNDDALMDLWLLLSRSDLKEVFEEGEKAGFEDLIESMASKAEKGKYTFADEIEINVCLAKLYKNALVGEMLSYLTPIMGQILKAGTPLSLENQVRLCDCLRGFVESLEQNHGKKALESLSRHINILAEIRKQKAGTENAKNA